MALVVPRRTWAPVFSCFNPGDLSVAYTTQVGYLGQSDSIFMLGINMTFTPTYTSASGGVYILGFPTPLPADLMWSGSLRLIQGITWPTGVSSITLGSGSASNNSLALMSMGASAVGASLGLTAFPSGTQVSIQGTFLALVP